MTAALLYTDELTVIACGKCHVNFAMPEEMYKRRRLRDHESFWCPNGHQRFFSGESDIEKERKRRIAVEARLARTEDRAEVLERQRRAAKGQLTKVKNRIKNGVCPFCNRTFANVADHMATQHHDEGAGEH